MTSVLSAPHFHDEEAAYAFLEARVWPNGPVCPHCGGVERISKMQGKSTRIGAYKCYQCRKPFTVKVGTVFEASHVPLHIWLQAIALLTASQEGHQQQPASPHLGRHPQNRLVHVAPHPRGNARRRRLPRWAAVAASSRPTKPTSGRRRQKLPRTAHQRPSLHQEAASPARATSARSSRWSSVAVRSVPSMSRTRTRRPST